MADTIDNGIKYLRLTILVCTLLTIISGVILFFIANKVNSEMEPIETRIFNAETKIDNHICDAEKKLNGFSSQVFHITIAGIEKSIQAVEKSQEKIDEKQDKLSDKIDALTTLIIEKINAH